jgi:hypothetical protein
MKEANNVLVLLWKSFFSCIDPLVASQTTLREPLLKLIDDAEQNFSEYFNYSLLFRNPAFLHFLSYKWLLDISIGFFFPLWNTNFDNPS